ncbi:hypothetical protein PYCC9005_003254 [Savitreella phatthalungensis]
MIKFKLGKSVSVPRMFSAQKDTTIAEIGQFQVFFSSARNNDELEAVLQGFNILSFDSMEVECVRVSSASLSTFWHY